MSPQLAMWANRIPVAFTLRYAIAPLEPLRPPVVTTAIVGQDGVSLEQSVLTVPTYDVDGAVDHLFRAGWGTYLYGEPGDLKAAMVSAKRDWVDWRLPPVK